MRQLRRGQRDRGVTPRRRSSSLRLCVPVFYGAAIPGGLAELTSAGSRLPRTAAAKQYRPRLACLALPQGQTGLPGAIALIGLVAPRGGARMATAAARAPGGRNSERQAIALRPVHSFCPMTCAEVLSSDLSPIGANMNVVHVAGALHSIRELERNLLQVADCRE